jgi:hypothetical protein
MTNENNHDIRFCLNDPAWVSYPKTVLEDRRIWPNEIRFNSSTNTAALIITQSPNFTECALNEAGLIDVCRAVKVGKIKAGIVVSVDRDGKEHCERPIEKVAADLKDIPPRAPPARNPRLGRYWWMNLDLTVNVSMLGPRTLSESDIPF